MLALAQQSKPPPVYSTHAPLTPPDPRLRSAAVGFIDAMSHPTRPIWSFQPHCEASPGFLEGNGLGGLGEGERAEAFGLGWEVVDGFVRRCVRGEASAGL